MSGVFSVIVGLTLLCVSTPGVPAGTCGDGPSGSDVRDLP